MKRIFPYVAVVAMAAALAGCNRGPGTNSAYNNSGANATPGSSSTTVTTTTSSPSTDTSSPGSSATTAAAPSTDTSTSTSTSTGNVVSDTVTTGKVKAAISTDPILKDADIVVKTDGGVVVLTGTAKSQDQVAMATSIAQRQDGVSRVDNQVTVK